MEINQENILKALSNVVEPDLKKDIVELGLVSNIAVEGDKVSFTVKVSNPAMHSRKRMEEACLHHLGLAFGDKVHAHIQMEALPKGNERPQEQRKVLPNVKNIIAISSGKGGVGKSTVTSNLAVALSKKGFKVGLVDADIFGPSIPFMFDVINEKPKAVQKGDKQLIVPVENYGVKMTSIGFFAEPDQAVVWRGSMATKALRQLLLDVDWGELDYLLIDLPPGTSDVHLTMVQTVPVTGAVVVGTPQEVALLDVKKAVGMFEMPQIKVPIIGLVENMAYFTPEELPGNKYYIFGRGGVKSYAEQKNFKVLAELPIVQSIREAGDVGRPAVMQDNTLQAKAFMDLADNFVKAVDERNASMQPTQRVQVS